MDAYRSIAKIPPCFCKSFPPGYLFYGWDQEDRSISYQEIYFKSNYMHKSIEHCSHTAECLKERQDESLTEIFSWSNNINIGPPAGTPGVWRWKTTPALGCYFLKHAWQNIRKRRGLGGNYDIDVCQCGAERIVSWTFHYHSCVPHRHQDDCSFCKRHAYINIRYNWAAAWAYLKHYRDMSTSAPPPGIDMNVTTGDTKQLYKSHQLW